MSHLRIASFFFLLGSALAQDTWKTWLNEGVRAFQSAHYREAVVAFQKSVDLSPTAVEPRLYLASSWMSQYIPGATSPENIEVAGNAERGFLAVLDLDPKNVPALESLATLKYLEAQGTPVPSEKLSQLDEARLWYLRVLEADPTRKEAHYSLGVIAWGSWYPAWNAARVQAGMRPDAPGPLVDSAVRADLRSRYDATLKDAIDHLNKALVLDPQYDDAMAYLNLLIREAADLAESPAACRTMIVEADAWVQKALDTRKAKAEQGGLPAAGGSGGGEGGGARLARPVQSPSEPASPPRRITVGGNVMQVKLISQTPPQYPGEAKQAGIEGEVLLQAIIGEDGSIVQLDVKSGHPTLSAAALEAVRQWKYTPTLLNGEPVEVVTLIHVNFVLGTSK